MDRKDLFLLQWANGVPTIPGTKIGLLSRTSKMPCQSFALPAIQSCPDALFGPGAICGESRVDGHTSCYATTGAYSWDSSINALAARFVWTRRAIATDSGMCYWAEYMTQAIEWATQKTKFFRVHDSGDMFNVRYIDAWYAVCDYLRDVDFWIPTRAWRNEVKLPYLVRLNSLPNVQVKPSALHFGDAPPVIDGLSGGTSASANVDLVSCVAPQQGGFCGDCRRCWSPLDTVYKAHGKDVHGLYKGSDVKSRHVVSKPGRHERIATFMTQWGQFYREPINAQFIGQG